MPFKIHVSPINGPVPPPKQEMKLDDKNAVTNAEDKAKLDMLEAKAKEAEAKALAEAEARSKAELEARVKQVEAEMRAREENLRLVQQQIDELNMLKSEHDSIKALHEEQVAKLEEGLNLIELQERTVPDRGDNVLTVDEIKKRIDEKLAKIEEIQTKAAASEPVAEAYKQVKGQPKAPPNTPTLKKKTANAHKSSVKIAPMALKSGGMKRTNSITSLGNRSDTAKQRWK